MEEHTPSLYQSGRPGWSERCPCPSEQTPGWAEASSSSESVAFGSSERLLPSDPHCDCASLLCPHSLLSPCHFPTGLVSRSGKRAQSERAPSSRGTSPTFQWQWAARQRWSRRCRARRGAAGNSAMDDRQSRSVEGQRTMILVDSMYAEIL